MYYNYHLFCIIICFAWFTYALVYWSWNRNCPTNRFNTLIIFRLLVVWRELIISIPWLFYPLIIWVWFFWLLVNQRRPQFICALRLPLIQKIQCHTFYLEVSFFYIYNFFEKYFNSQLEKILEKRSILISIENK